MSWRHALRQGPVLASFLRLLASGRGGRLGPLPGPELSLEFGSPSRDLVRDYLRHLGARGDVEVLPPHLFPKWCFAATGRLIGGLPFPMGRAVNAGCRVQSRAAIPLSEPLHLRGRLERVDETERRVLVTQSFVLSSPSAPDALHCEVDLLVKKRGAPKRAVPRDPERVPEGAQEIGRFAVGPADALRFAQLTGDFNPLHWSERYARRAGFDAVILHGFATMARAWLAAEAHEARPLTGWSCRFLAPVVLPTEFGVFADGRAVYVGESPGAIAQLAAAAHVPA